MAKSVAARWAVRAEQICLPALPVLHQSDALHHFTPLSNWQWSAGLRSQVSNATLPSPFATELSVLLKPLSQEFLASL